MENFSIRNRVNQWLDLSWSDIPKGQRYGESGGNYLAKQLTQFEVQQKISELESPNDRHEPQNKTTCKHEQWTRSYQILVESGTLNQVLLIFWN